MFGLGGPCLDYEKLIKLGIPGLLDLVKKRKQRAIDEEKNDLSFYDTMLNAIDIFKENALDYASQAIEASINTVDYELKKKYETIHNSLVNIVNNKPETFRQGLQLMWLYSLMSLVKNYGRMDMYLGDLLANDLDSGRLSYDEALDITIGFWKLVLARGDNFNNRIIIGGKGRKNEKNADRFALLALEAQKIVNDAIPQLSLRWYEGMNKEIWDKSFEVLATGSTMPIIYNDEKNIPGIKKAMEVSYEEAEQYAFYGCGEFLIDHKAIASPDAAFNVLKALDVTLRNGVDSFTGKKQGLTYKYFKDFSSFQELLAAFSRQIEYQIAMLADAQAIIYMKTGEDASFPFLSMLYENCIERGKPLLAGGVKYPSGTVECFGNNSAADSLYAIKKLVFDNKLITAEKLTECLDKNFEDCEKEWKMMKSIPKFGNDFTEADEMSLWVNETVCKAAIRQKNYTTLYSFLVVNINNGDSVLHGKTTGASADGRKKGEPLSNGNQPSAGNDINGATALLNSMAKLEASFHAGTTQNLKLNRSVFKDNPENIKALIKGYFSQGGTQIMITTTDKGEMENALIEPDKYRHLFVRVGGYSERFVDLPKDIRNEVLKRTLY